MSRQPPLDYQARIAAIVLAAGLSQRMGRLKPLLLFGDRPMLARVVETLRSVPSLAPIIIVTGHQATEIRTALRDYEVLFAHNDNYASGMLSSVQTGVRALPEDTAAFFLVLGDQPTVAPATLQALSATWHTPISPRPAIVVPAHGGRRGHPVLFAATCAAEILALPEVATLKTCVQRHRHDTVEVAVDDPTILADVDTPEDYERALAWWRARNHERAETSP